MKIFNLRISQVFLMGSLAFFGGTSCTRKPVSSVHGEMRPLRIHVASEPVALDPALAEDGLSLQLLSNILNGLTATTAEGKTELRQAESVKISDDRLTYKFTLRPNLKWSDGTPVLAHHYREAFRRVLHPKTASRIGVLFTGIEGSEAYRTGKVPFESVKISAHDLERTLEFKLTHPVPYFLGLFSLPEAFPLPSEQFAANQNVWNEKLPTNGPYFFKKWERDKVMAFEPNPHFAHENGIPRPVELLVVSDESTALRLFESKDLDLLQRVSSFEVMRLRKEGKLKTFPFFATYFLAFNVKKPPFQKKELRLRVAEVLNGPKSKRIKEELMQVLGSGEVPAYSWVSAGLEGYFSDPLQIEVPASAAKHPMPKGVELRFDSNSRNQTIAEKIQADLKLHLGMEVHLQTQDWKSYVKLLHSDTPAIYRFGWMAPFADPITHLKVFVTGGENNHSGYSNLKYDELVAKIDRMDSGPERTKLIIEAQKIIMVDDPVVLPIYHYGLNYAVGERVRVLEVNPFSIVTWSKL